MQYKPSGATFQDIVGMVITRTKHVREQLLAHVSARARTSISVITIPKVKYDKRDDHRTTIMRFASGDQSIDSAG